MLDQGTELYPTLQQGGVILEQRGSEFLSRLGHLFFGDRPFERRNSNGPSTEWRVRMVFFWWPQRSFSPSQMKVQHFRSHFASP